MYTWPAALTVNDTFPPPLVCRHMISVLAPYYYGTELYRVSADFSCQRHKLGGGKNAHNNTYLHNTGMGVVIVNDENERAAVS